MRTPETFGSAIVIVAAFNPAIYTPDWLFHAKLIGVSDVAAAKASPEFVITGMVCNYHTDTFILQVLQDRLYLESNGVLTPALADLAIGILTVSGHVEVQQMGLNFFANYKMPDVASYHKVGDVLAPKNIWESAFGQAGSSIGMQTVAIKIQPFERDVVPNSKDEIRLTVQPSPKISRGVFLAINHHSEIAERTAEKSKVEAAVEIIEKNWETKWHQSLVAFDKLLDAVANA